MPDAHLKIDAPGTICMLGTKACSRMVAGHGGFDQHHEFPVSLGGAAMQTTLLTLCPNHHHRQHSLIRFLIESMQSGAFRPDPAVLKQFTARERMAAEMAVQNWEALGSPKIEGWPTPAARVA